KPHFETRHVARRARRRRVACPSPTPQPNLTVGRIERQPATGYLAYAIPRRNAADKGAESNGQRVAAMGRHRRGEQQCLGIVSRSLEIGRASCRGREKTG